MFLLNLQSLEEYRKSRSHIFPSYGSIQWFIRQNREVLMGLNALSYPTRRLMINASAFDEAVLAIGQKAVHGSKQNDPA
jgi:hypothetical protein